MDPTLADGEILFVVKHLPIDRFDIVVAHEEDGNKDIVKRVIGMPGDTIRYENDKLYINDKACFGNFNVKAENLEEAYDIAYTTLASKLSGILPDIDIPYYVEAIKEEGYPRYRVLSYNSEKDEKECFITSDHTEARVKYDELDGESDAISLFIQTSHEAGWSVLKHRLSNRVKF